MESYLDNCAWLYRNVGPLQDHFVLETRKVDYLFLPQTILDQLLPCAILHHAANQDLYRFQVRADHLQNERYMIHIEPNTTCYLHVIGAPITATVLCIFK